ncbi:MAG: ABC transporter substrate-binding protein [Xanthobacteraceae bacterium]|nr:ABC transporter substrate-binding protein [Xanthobacteraceae bacterium]MBX3521752.1 ABC transporter substrate-binding protein [Xanthobacteraceae bacterium]MBX3535007.1 ABC transporter substrate-binding protein [Xanthobacteraceae bacterium]MBX3550560.1 ABC transporter substrate-binding protein [Xanthobacteraceae bacterium]MCW5673449.1 ABC transporter substrate-binding protein [Xanthobacteraceae bacterium]
MASKTRVTRRTFTAGLGAAGIVAGTAPFNIISAQGAPLKVGVLLPRSGAQAGIGQDCQRGVDVTAGLLKDLKLPALQIMNGDTETNVEVARARAERLINEGAQLLVGAFDSGQSTAIAQVAEQKGIPYVINIAAAPPITEQGYKFVFRNFPVAGRILADAFENQIEIFKATGNAPKTAVFMHVNDTFGTAMQKGISAVSAKFAADLPYKIVETIAYDGTARDLSVEVAKAKATGAEALVMVSRLNDAILITRELIKQRWSPKCVLSMGPGWYEDQYLKTLGKFGDGPMSFVPWYDPNKKLTKALDAALAKAHPGVNLNTNHVYTFEALLVAADAYKRAGSADPKALADAIRATNIKDNVSPGPGIQFDAKGQNSALKNSAIQNRAGKLVTIAPASASNAKPEHPMKPYDKR